LTLLTLRIRERFRRAGIDALTLIRKVLIP